MTTPTCTMCSAKTPNEFPEHNDNDVIQPTGGLHLSIYTGYGMFTDPMDEKSYKALDNIRLCHDCSIKIIDMFPQEFKDNFFTGGHPVEICREQSNTHPDGCHYAWA